MIHQINNVMNKDIQAIYYNNFGIVFKWDKTIARDESTVQMVFRDMGFYLTYDEIGTFYNNVHIAKKCLTCKFCAKNGDKRNILLRTPCEKIDIVVDKHELKSIEDLIEGTLFQLKLDNYIEQLCKY